MVALPLLMVGVLVALAAKVMLVLPPLGIQAFTEAMSLVSDLENKGEREKLVLLGRLVLKMFPLLLALSMSNCQESPPDPKLLALLVLARVYDHCSQRWWRLW